VQARRGSGGCCGRPNRGRLRTGGRATGGDPANGKKLFLGQGRCASCHTLADAGSKGTVGPNLDDAFRSDRAQGFAEDTIEQVVLDQIRLAILPMPKNLVRGSDARDVAAYVAMCGAPPTPCNIQVAAAAPGGGKGAQLYASLGCQACHTINGAKSTGPTFNGLFGSPVKLANGQTVTANEAYLLESILDPDKQIVAGYSPGIMSATIKPHSVSMANAKALVQFIKAQK
jgi:cytochrome c2